jgi:hypothetical protein
MLNRLFVYIALAASLAACDDSNREASKRDSRTAARARAGVEDLGHKTERAFRKVGGHLQKFFTGRDTITQ